MKIKAEKSKYISFSEIKNGESFWYGEILCMRVYAKDSYYNNAIDLSDGRLIQILSSRSILLADVEIVNSNNLAPKTKPKEDEDEETY